jgi:hypothetical protein
MHKTNVIQSLLRSTFTVVAVACASLVGGCDEGDVSTRSGHAQVVEVIAEHIVDGEEDGPTPVAELAICDDEAVEGEGCGGATEKELTTICYCGYVPGRGVVYVTTNCAGYPGTHVCCAAACSAGEGADPGQG